MRSWLAAALFVLTTGSGCTTVIIGKPPPCPAPTTAADHQLQGLYAAGLIRPGDPLDRELGAQENYCDSIDSLRGEL